MLCACAMVFFNPTKPRPPTPATMSVRMAIPKATLFPMIQCFIKLVFVLEVIGQAPFRLSNNQRIGAWPITSRTKTNLMKHWIIGKSVALGIAILTLMVAGVGGLGFVGLKR